jgi:hypothetical protein
MVDNLQNIGVSRDKNRVDDFILAEYPTVRDEVLMIIGQVATLESTALLASGAIWAWVSAQSAGAVVQFAVWLPLVVSQGVV